MFRSSLERKFTAETQRAQRNSKIIHRKGAKDAKKSLCLKNPDIVHMLSGIDEYRP
jgi:hypothetical protein